MILNIYLAATSALFIIMGMVILKNIFKSGERYFSVNVEYQSINNNKRFETSIALKSKDGTFFNRDLLKKTIEKNNNIIISQFVIKNIFEFKNEDDYLFFITELNN